MVNQMCQRLWESKSMTMWIPSQQINEGEWHNKENRLGTNLYTTKRTDWVQIYKNGV